MNAIDKKIWFALIGWLSIGAAVAVMKEYAPTDANVEEKLVQMSRSSTSCAVKRLDGEYVIADEEDAVFIEKCLNELEDQWLDAPGFAQVLVDSGSWFIAGDHEGLRKRWEEPSGRLYIYKNGLRIHDILLTVHCLCIDKGELDEHRYMKLHSDEPLYKAICRLKSPEYIAPKTASEHARKPFLPTESCKSLRYDREKMENGMAAYRYRLTKYIREHAKSGIEMEFLFRNLDLIEETESGILMECVLSTASYPPREGGYFLLLKPENLRIFREWFDQLEANGQMVPENFKMDLEIAEKIKNNSHE